MVLAKPLCPREEAVFVHKIVRSLLIAGFGYQVQNWKFEVFNQGKWKLPPFTRLNKQQARKTGRSASLKVCQVTEKQGWIQKILADLKKKQVCSVEAGQSQTASEMHLHPSLSTHRASLPHPTFTLSPPPVLTYGFQFPA